MSRFLHKLLSVTVSLMLVITASFVPEIFNFSTARAVGTYQAESGVYDLLGTSTNDHTDAYYIWEFNGVVYVAVTVNVNENQLNDVQMNGISADTIDYLGKSVPLVVMQDGNQALNVIPPQKTPNNPNSWVVAGFNRDKLPSSFLLSVLTPGGHAITNVSYTVKGLLDVWHEYPPTAPTHDDGQSLGSNSLGGIAAGTYTINPVPATGFEYQSVVIEIDGVVIGTAVLGTASSFTFTDGSISISGSGVVSLVLTQSSGKEFDFTFSYQKIDYLLTIIYEFMGGATAAPTHTETLNYMDSYSVPSPSISGYTPNVATVSGTMPASNRTVTVTYAANIYTFTFVPNWGSEVNVNENFSIGGSVSPPSFVRDGYTFAGWTTDATGLIPYTEGFTNLPPEDKTVYAQWTAIDYTFTFVPNWGSETNETRNFNVGGNVTPPTFTRDGFTFTGWTVDAAGLTPYDAGFSNLTSGNKIVYAQWSINTYTFTFVPNWGSETNEVFNFNIGGSVTPPTFTRDGYTFTGWTSDAAGLTPYDAGFSNLTSGNKTVYAQWSINTYTFTFMPNGGTEAADIQNFSIGGSVTPPTFTRLGYTFTGWTIDEAGLTPYIAGYTNLSSGNKIVYAQWSINTYTFTFMPNGGAEAADIQNFSIGGSVTPPTFTRLGYTFTGWALDMNGLEPYNTFTNLTVGNKVVYAQWVPINYTFTFDPNFGTGDTVVQNFNIGGSVAGTTFTRTGYTFDGWTLDEAGLIEYTGGLTNLPAQNIYVYAQWEAIDYSFTFNPNGGSGVANVQTFNVGGSVIEATFSRTGYTFDGWTLDAEGTMDYMGGFTNLPAQNIEVFAQWEAIDYTFTFDPNWGEEENVVQEFNVGGSVEGVVFVREGFIFDGWTLDAAGTTDYLGGLDNLPAENIYVYAQWSEVLGEDDDIFTLTYVTNMPGLTVPSVEFKEGDAIAKVVIAKEGYIFQGWFIDEELTIEFDEFSNMPGRDITLYADWAEVLGDDDDLPDTRDGGWINIAYGTLLLGIMLLLISKKEEEYN
mgnify:CR=1 FL=1